MIQRTVGPFTICEAEHCGRCALGNDRGVLGEAFTCAVDGVQRYQFETCAHPAQFAEDARSLEEKYPAYGEDFWTKTARNNRVQDWLLQKETGKPAQPGVGTPVFSFLGKGPKLADGSYKTKPKGAA